MDGEWERRNQTESHVLLLKTKGKIFATEWRSRRQKYACLLSHYTIHANEEQGNRSRKKNMEKLNSQRAARDPRQSTYNALQSPPIAFSGYLWIFPLFIWTYREAEDYVSILVDKYYINCNDTHSVLAREIFFHFIIRYIFWNEIGDSSQTNSFETDWKKHSCVRQPCRLLNHQCATSMRSVNVMEQQSDDSNKHVTSHPFA